MGPWYGMKLESTRSREPEAPRWLWLCPLPSAPPGALSSPSCGLAANAALADSGSGVTVAPPAPLLLPGRREASLTRSRAEADLRRPLLNSDERRLDAVAARAGALGWYETACCMAAAEVEVEEGGERGREVDVCARVRERGACWGMTLRGSSALSLLRLSA